VASLVYTQYFSPRGLNDRQTNSSVLFLVDGHPCNEAMFGMIDPLWVPLTNVKRIEIIKGPGSALYGANAFTGVINVITKDLEDIPRPKFSGAMGSYETQKQEFLGGFGSNGMEGIFSYWHYKTAAVNGHMFTDNDNRKDLKLYAKIKKGGLTVSADHYDTGLGVPGSTASPTPTFRETVYQDFVTLDYSATPVPGLNAKLLTHALKTYRELDDQLLGRVNAASTRLGSELQTSFRPSASHTVTAGIEWKQETTDSESAHIHKTMETKAAYLQEEWRPAEALIFTLGGRYDIPSAFPSIFSPRINMVYKHSDATVFKTSYGEAFRAPNFQELYADLMISNYIHFSGNPDLKPEKIKAVEAGFSHLFSARVQTGMNFFYIHALDSVQFVSLGDQPPYQMSYSNRSEVEVLGGEATLKASLTPSIGATFSYSYQDSKNITLDEEMGLAPRHKFIMLWDILLDTDIRLNTQTYYNGSKLEYWRDDGITERIAPVAVTNARLSLALSKELELSVTAYNLFDARYEEMVTMPIGGRSFLTELQYRF
ncbi:MAG: TonB-dependent receptor plug domain-containing protein, partial [Endomicrobiales bacterium]